MPVSPDIFEAIYEIVRQIPRGRVSTYGHIAAALGMKSGARLVGYAMNHSHGILPEVPAQRVVNRNGLLTGKSHFGPGNEMADLLRQDGVLIIENERIGDFQNILWDPAKEMGM